MARRRTAKLDTPARLRIIASPATLEVFEALQVGGPATATELGPRLARKPNSLHYHIRKLSRTGLIRPVDSRRSGARTETVYDVVAHEFVGSPAPGSTTLRRITADAVASLLRLAIRNYTRALERPDAITPTGRHRNLLAHRRKARLTRAQLAEVNAHIRALERIFSASANPRSGTLHALTTVLVPLEHPD